MATMVSLVLLNASFYDLHALDDDQGKVDDQGQARQSRRRFLLTCHKPATLPQAKNALHLAPALAPTHDLPEVHHQEM